jgi:hypothetical protein
MRFFTGGNDRRKCCLKAALRRKAVSNQWQPFHSSVASRSFPHYIKDLRSALGRSRSAEFGADRQLSTKQRKSRNQSPRSRREPGQSHRHASSVQCGSLLIVRLHRLDFYVVPRKLIAKLQAFSKSIQETSMMRFHSSVYSDDEMLIRHVSCDSAFHRIPPPKIGAAHRTKTECPGSAPDAIRLN